MRHADKILGYGRAIIGVDELQRLIGEPDYRAFHQLVDRLAQEGRLAPVKSSRTNGMLPPLFNRYRIIRPPGDHTADLEAIRLLNPALNISGYLQRPELYRKHRTILDGLSRCLWYAPELLRAPMSRKERSFSLWGREKLYDEHPALVGEVLKFNHLDEDFLNCYGTPEPFFEYVHARHEQMTVLILENKDTWYTFRRLMQETGKSTVADTRIDVLLYGEGNKIAKGGALEQYGAGMLYARIAPGVQTSQTAQPQAPIARSTPAIQAQAEGAYAGQASPQGARFLYFGDLDHEGIRLFFRALEANPSLEIRPFAALYALMLRLAEGLALPKSLDKRGIMAPVAEFASMLELNGSSPLTDFLDKGRYIPQEIVNYQVISGILS